MNKKRNLKKEKQRQGLQQIKRLFNQAKEQARENPKQASSYLEKALETARKLQVKIPKNLRRSYCKSCKIPFIPGFNCRVRIKRGIISCYCNICKKYRRWRVS